MGLKLPPFHKFVDPTSNSRKALLLNASQLDQYIGFISTIFTNSHITLDNDQITIKKHICPKTRLTAVLWSAHIFIVATVKKPFPYPHIAVYGPLMFNSTDKIDDSLYKRILAKSVFENWGIDLRT